MAFQAKQTCTPTASFFSFQRAFIPLPSRVSYEPHPPLRRFVPLSVVKRNPKRLKYTAPRFTKENLLYVEVDSSGTDSWKLDPVVQLLREGAVGVIPTDTVYGMVCDPQNHSAIERLRRIKNADTTKPLSILCRSFKDIDTYTTGFPRGTGQGLSNIFRAVKHCLPGPYTFILTASKALPKQCTKYGTSNPKYASRKSVGVRVPSDAVCQAILEKIGAPLVSTSVKSPRENEWIIDPVVIADVYGAEDKETGNVRYKGLSNQGLHKSMAQKTRASNQYYLCNTWLKFTFQVISSPLLLSVTLAYKGLDFVVDAGIRIADPSTVVDMTGSIPRIIRQGKGPKQQWMVTDEDVAEE